MERPYLVFISGLWWTAFGPKYVIFFIRNFKVTVWGDFWGSFSILTTNHYRIAESIDERWSTLIDRNGGVGGWGKRMLTTLPQPPGFFCFSNMLWGERGPWLWPHINVCINVNTATAVRVITHLSSQENDSMLFDNKGDWSHKNRSIWPVKKGLTDVIA